MGAVILDASVVIAQGNARDAHHKGATAVLLEYRRSELYLPASADAESLVGHVRAGTVSDARKHLARVGVEVVPVDRDMAEIAAHLRAYHRRLRLPDALVLACGELLDADAVLTADARWRRLPRVRVV